MPRKLRKQAGLPWECPSCGKEKLVNPENWYQAKDGRWASSCRTCAYARKNIRKKAARRGSKQSEQVNGSVPVLPTVPVAPLPSWVSQTTWLHSELQKQLETELGRYFNMREAAAYLVAHKKELGLATTPTLATLTGAAREGRLAAVFKGMYLTNEEALQVFASSYKPQNRTRPKN